MRRGTARCRAVSCGVARHGVVSCGAARRGAVRCSAVRVCVLLETRAAVQARCAQLGRCLRSVSLRNARAALGMCRLLPPAASAPAPAPCRLMFACAFPGCICPDPDATCPGCSRPKRRGGSDHSTSSEGPSDAHAQDSVGAMTVSLSRQHSLTAAPIFPSRFLCNTTRRGGGVRFQQPGLST